MASFIRLNLIMNESAKHGDGDSQPHFEQGDEHPSATTVTSSEQREESTPATNPPSTSQKQEEEEPSPHAKPCSLCHRPRNVLIRCQIDRTHKWHFICPGKCWQEVSGGTRDGDRDHPDYKYGGMWKNKHEYVSAKIKGKAKENSKELSGGFKGPHRRPGWQVNKYRNRKDILGVKGKEGKVEGVDDREIGDEEFWDYNEDEDEKEEEDSRSRKRDDVEHVQVKHIDK